MRFEQATRRIEKPHRFKAARIRLAHSSLLTAGQVASWRQHLADYAVEPPFDQLGRDLPVLDVTQAKATTITDREGWMIASEPP